MNHRYEDQSYGRSERERERGQSFESGDRSREGSREFYPGNYGFEDQREGQHYRQGQFGQSQYGQGQYREGYQGGSSNWRPQQQGGSYGGYGTTGDYGYGSQGSSGMGRSWFGSGEQPSQYYGTGHYSTGGSGFGGGYGGIPGGLGTYGPSGGYAYGDRSLSERGGQQRPGLLGRLLGRGPKGYKRSDERLKEDISERLMQSDSIDSSEVTVEVVGGKVSLEGTVPERYMKHAIEDLVDTCVGVQDIDNRIRVVSGAASMSGSSSGSSQTTTTATPTTGNGGSKRKSGELS